jgi:DNA gyrase subunit A
VGSSAIRTFTSSRVHAARGCAGHDKGQLIRCPVEGIRIAGRSTQGVIVFDTAEDEHVVSVEHITEETESGNAENGNANGE